MRSIDRVRDAYGAAVARMVRFSVICLVMVAIAGAGIVGLNKVTPTGFLPEDDQGTLFEPFEERKDASQGVHALIGRLGEKFRQVQGGVVDPLAPPPIIGLGTGGGFSYVLEDLR